MSVPAESRNKAAVPMPSAWQSQLDFLKGSKVKQSADMTAGFDFTADRGARNKPDHSKCMRGILWAFGFQVIAVLLALVLFSR